ISMPDWAKAIGSCLPLTYFIRLVKGIMLKGYSAQNQLQALQNVVILFHPFTYAVRICQPLY
ncbi:hypothetical protein CP989_24790, partial [Enterobacter hormaechei]